MKFSHDVSIGDIVSALLLLTALVGLLFTWLQLRKNNETQRAIFFKDLYSALFFDLDMSYALSLIEGRTKVDFSRSEIHDPINKLLAHCELTSALYLRHAISKDEMIHFKYNLIRTYENPNIKKYFKDIDKFNKRWRFTNGPFAKFRVLGPDLVTDR